MKLSFGITLALVLMGIALVPTVKSAIDAKACPGDLYLIQRTSTPNPGNELVRIDNKFTCTVSSYATCVSCCANADNYEMPRMTGVAQSLCASYGVSQCAPLYNGHFLCAN